MSLIRRVIFYSMDEMDTHPTKRKALNVNSIQNYLQVASRITSLFVLTNLEVKYLPQSEQIL